jgi:bifunctional DNA-binding transcriptional regulator/antitoxin component of YhaV-PrlF toxin-antitoxin module
MAGKTGATVRDPISRVGQRRQVVIPREIFDNLRMRVGDFVAFTKHGNGVLVRPRPAVGPDDVPDDALTPAEAKRLRQSLKQTRQGKTRPWAGIKRELGL